MVMERTEGGDGGQDHDTYPREAADEINRRIEQLIGVEGGQDRISCLPERRVGWNLEGPDLR